LKSAPRPRLFYTGRWGLNTAVCDIRSLLEEHGVSIMNIEVLKTMHSKFRSFKFECDVKFSSIVLSSELWPEGVTIKRFFEPRKTASTSVSTSVVSVTPEGHIEAIVGLGQTSYSNKEPLSVNDSDPDTMNS